MVKSKKGQVTIFIILAIIIVVAGLSIYLFRDTILTKKIPSNIEPIQTNFLNCIEQSTLTGISILESKGGYIENPSFVSGSVYMPFSSELNFVGTQIPYWYYISGNNIEFEQMPSIEEMNKQLENYLTNKLMNCNFEIYKNQGYEIETEQPQVNVNIKNNNVQIEVDMDLSVGFQEDIFLMKSFSVEVNSLLGDLYDDAKKVYELEQERLFLENYSVDVLYLYTPVDGVELSCSPLFWNVDEFYSDFSEALVANINSLKNKGNINDYFAIELPIDSELRFLTSTEWPKTFEVTNADSNILVAKPVGNQEGMGILGFCYVPYHFVYNVRYPVLVQLSSFGETFQFPMAVIIDRNMPREGKSGSSSVGETSNICEYKNNNLLVSLYDSDLNFVEGEVSYECFGANCYIGSTENGKLNGVFPQCVNGNVKISSEGFKDSYVNTGISEGEVVIILDKEYELEIELYAENNLYSGKAIVNFIGEDSSFSLVYPNQKEVVLSEGQYDIQIYFYKNSSLKFEETTREYCTEIPSSGIKGFFGFEEEECFETVIPEQEINNVLIGGGNTEYYFIEQELKNSNKLVLRGEELNVPNSLEQLAQNYLLIENQKLGVEFR
jgi:hypothetical protein